jgi:hypothetical protein
MDELSSEIDGRKFDGDMLYMNTTSEIVGD